METTVTQFKAKCLGIIERVQREKLRVVISRHGRPAAVLVPPDPEPNPDWFGRARARTSIHGDIVTAGESWDADA